MRNIRRLEGLVLGKNTTNSPTIKSAPAFHGKITTAGKDTDAQGNLTEIEARDRGGIQWSLGSIVPPLNRHCLPSLVEMLSVASTVTHIGMMREGTRRNYFANLH